LESMPPLPTHIRDRLQAKLNESMLDGTVIERLLLDAIREVANDPRRGVSQDCVTTSLVPQRDPFAVVRYNPLPIAHTASVMGSQLPVSYTGWIVTPGMTEPPRLLLLTENFGRTAQTGWLRIGFVGPSGHAGINAQVALRSRR
jgi:hypothetical protein